MRVLVTGATGTVGRPLVDALLRAGAEVRAVTRDRAAARLPGQAELVEGDPSKPGAITSALHGVGSLFLHPRAVGDAARDLVALAAEHGVHRVVALAAANVDDGLAEQPSRYRGDRNKEAEQAAADSGLRWASLRPSSFAVNALFAWGDQIREGDLVRYVYGSFEESPIHERDLAEVAARALLSDELAGRRLELTGPQSLSHQEMVSIIGETIGRPIHFEEIPPDAAAARMRERCFPAPFVAALMARYAAHARQPQYPPTRAVETILGRPALTFAEWVTDHASAFRR